MKYMTFNGACTFAGLANLLEAFHIDKEDYELAVEMKLPYLFEYDDVERAYATGASLQRAAVMNRYLNSLGVHFSETLCMEQEVLSLLHNAKKPTMVGIVLDTGEKHAVILSGYENDEYVFTNNRYFGTDEPKEYRFDAHALRGRLKPPIVFGWLETCHPQHPCFDSALAKSLRVLTQYRHSLMCFCHDRQTYEALQASMNPLFRPLLLDGLTMMRLIGDQKMSLLLEQLQLRFLAALRKRSALMLSDELPMEQIEEAFAGYEALIRAQLET